MNSNIAKSVIDKLRNDLEWPVQEQADENQETDS